MYYYVFITDFIVAMPFYSLFDAFLRLLYVVNKCQLVNQSVDHYGCKKPKTKLSDKKMKLSISDQ